MEGAKQNGDHDARVDSVEQHGERVVVAFSWADSEGGRHQWAQVLKLERGKIVDMRDYANPARAAAVTRLRTLTGS